MEFDKKYIGIIAILGILLLYSYYFFAKKNNVQKLWGNIHGKLLLIYYISMILTAIAFLLFFYYLFISTSFEKKQTYHIFIALSLVIILSMFWMPLSLQYMKNKSPFIKFSIYAVLFFIPCAVLYIIHSCINIKENKYKIEKKIAIFSMIYFFIHTFFLDFLLWTHNFFN